MNQPCPAPKKAPPFDMIAGALFILCALLNIVQILSIFIQWILYHAMVPSYIILSYLMEIAATFLLALSSFTPKLRVLLLAGNVLFIVLQLFSAVVSRMSAADLPRFILALTGYAGMCVLAVLTLARSPQTAKAVKVIWFIPPVILFLSSLLSFVKFFRLMLPAVQEGAFPQLFTILRVGLQSVLPCIGMLFAALALTTVSGQRQG